MKLIKKKFDGWSNYYLINNNGDTIGTTKYPFPPEMLKIAEHKNIELLRLSHENCESVELGYGLEGLNKKEFLENLKFDNQWDVEFETEGESDNLKLDLNGCVFLKNIKL